MMSELNDAETASLASYDPNEMRISIFADSARGRDDATSVAQGAKARVLFAGDLSAGERLFAPVSTDAVLVDLRHDLDEVGSLFLDRLDAVAEAQGMPVLVNCVPETIDAAAGAMSAPSVVLMCDADSADWAAALAMVRMPRALMLNDAVVDDGFRLQRLADEVSRIARTLADLAGNPPAARGGFRDAVSSFRAEPPGPSQAVGVRAGDVREIIRLRRLRDRFFASDLFADPAWDMLLDLVAARIERTRVAVSSLCIAAAVPPTTALRWIKTMTDDGMFVRAADPEDGRRIFIELSEASAAGMIAYLRAVKASEGLAI